MKRYLPVLATVVIVLIGWKVFSSVDALRSSVSSFRDEIRAACMPPKPKVNAEVVIEKLTRKSLFLTSRTEFSATIHAEVKSRARGAAEHYAAFPEWLRKLGMSALTRTVSGDVLAGLDFSALKASDFSIQDRDIEVTVPPTRVLLSRIDFQKRVDGGKEAGLLGPADGDEIRATAVMYLHAQRDAEARMCEGEPYAMLQSHSEAALRELLLTMGFARVKVRTTPGLRGECMSQPWILDGGSPFLTVTKAEVKVGKIHPYE